MKPINMDKILKAYRSGAGAAYSELTGKLNDAINEAEGRATVRQITAETICQTLIHIEKTLGIPKASMNGIVAFCDPNAQKFPNAYKYAPMSTQFRAEYKNGHWVVTNISREIVCAPGRAISLNLTDEAKKAIIWNNTYFAA